MLALFIYEEIYPDWSDLLCVYSNHFIMKRFSARWAFCIKDRTQDAGKRRQEFGGLASASVFHQWVTKGWKSFWISRDDFKYLNMRCCVLFGDSFKSLINRWNSAELLLICFTDICGLVLLATMQIYNWATGVKHLVKKCEFVELSF